MTDPHVSIAICTRNRASSLRRTLARIAEIEVPSTITYEIVVVDNGSSDGTAEAVRTFEGRLPLRRVLEPSPGISNARNRAVREIRGSYIVWTDDDVLVDRNWLAAYVRAFNEWPEAAVFGGPIEPLFEAPKPDWLERNWDELAECYAIVHAPEAVAVEPEAPPFGANFAITAATQRAVRYDETIGRKPGRLAGGEETDVIRRVLSGGRSGRWVPDARVFHVIPKTRMTIDFLRDHFIGQGELWGINSPDPSVRLGKYPRWILPRLFAAEARFRLKRLLGRRDWLPDLADSGHLRGQLRAATHTDARRQAP